MIVRLFALGILLSLTSSVGFAQANLENLNDSASYAVGVNFALAQLKPNLDQAKAQGVEFNVEVLIQAMRDVIAEDGLLISETAGQQILVRWQQAHMLEMLQKNNKEAAKFFVENASKPGVKVAANGLQYMVITEGSGTPPAATDSVVVKYRGALLDGTVFDQTQEGETRTFYVSGLIEGWTQALQMMKPGAKWKVFLPSNLAYGQQGTPGIPPGAALVFDMELVAVKKP
ncbi:MAG: FKBP-type peptidyl-prolyl cis-trans isomerase [Candidatus Kapaibacterium sp.]